MMQSLIKSKFSWLIFVIHGSQWDHPSKFRHLIEIFRSHRFFKDFNCPRVCSPYPVSRETNFGIRIQVLKFKNWKMILNNIGLDRASPIWIELSLNWAIRDSLSRFRKLGRLLAVEFFSFFSVLIFFYSIL